MSLAVCFCTSLKCMLRFLFYYPLLSYTVYPPFIVNLPSFVLTPITPPSFAQLFSFDLAMSVLLPFTLHLSIHQSSAEQFTAGKGRRKEGLCSVSTLSLFDCPTVSISVIESSQLYRDLMRQQLTTSQSCAYVCVCLIKLI